MTHQLLVREAKTTDVPAIRLLIQEFAEFEKLVHWCEVGEIDLHEAIFGERKFVQALVAMDANRYVGYALFFPVFKSFRGERSMFLEDLYVTPDVRGNNLGFIMLCEVARLADAQNCVRLDWQTLKWNERAIKFYTNLGAESDDENLDFRLRGEAFFNCSDKIFINSMQIKSVELIEIKMPLVHFFETSFGRTYERRIILTRVEDADGNEGWGECTVGETPSYCEEWTDAAWAVLEKILALRVIGKEVEAAAEIWDLMKPVRGNRMAKAAIETACWDLEAKNLNVPLWKHLGGTKSEIECGVSIGIQDSVEQLFEQIETELNAGYKRVKIKIAPHWDYEIIKAVRQRFGDILLMGDANSAYTLSADVEKLKSLDEFDLMMLEQPLSYDDIIDHAKLQREIKTPICLDEPIRSPDDARKAIELKSGKIINLKNGRVGGHSESKRIEAICRESGVPVWCGGMLESGIGRAHNIAMSTLPGFTLPGDVSASKRYWVEDIIEPPVEVTAQGTIIASEKAGIGFDVKTDRIEKLAVRRVKI